MGVLERAQRHTVDDERKEQLSRLFGLEVNVSPLESIGLTALFLESGCQESSRLHLDTAWPTRDRGLRAAAAAPVAHEVADPPVGEHEGRVVDVRVQCDVGCDRIGCCERRLDQDPIEDQLGLLGGIGEPGRRKAGFGTEDELAYSLIVNRTEQREHGVGHSGVWMGLRPWTSLGALALACHSAPHDRPRASAVEVEPSAVATHASPTTTASRSAPSASAPAKPIGLKPLEAESPMVSLPVEGFGEAIVSLPIGARRPRPIVLALHGNFDRPEWQCEVWREITKGFPWVLCPRGIPRRDVPKREDRWEWGSTAQTDREIMAAVEALRVAQGHYVAEGPILFTGFSLGAILALGIIKQHPGMYGPVVLIEGGTRLWTKSTAQRIFGDLSDAGTSPQARMLMACGQVGCEAQGRALAKKLELWGVGARVVLGKNAGHTYDGPVASAIQGEWAWLIEGDPRYLADPG